MSMERSIGELVIQTKNRDEKAAEELIRLTEGRAYAVARALCRNEQDAKDVVQDCYMKAFSQLDKLNDPSRFEQWLSSMVRNACYDLFRSSAYAKTNVFSDMSAENEDGDVIELEPIDMHSTYQPEVSLDEKTKKEIVFDILAKLPDDQRAAIVCMYYEDMKISDIAKEMQCSENTIKSRLNYARKKIAEEVELYEKKYDIRLYNVAPLPLFFAWFTSTTKDMEVSMANIITKKACKKIIKGTIAKHGTKALLSSQAATKAGLSTAAKITISATVGIGVTAGVTTAAVKVYENHEAKTNNNPTITNNEELPSTLIKDGVNNPVIWAVDPDEHAYDNVESMTFLSGRSTDWHEFPYGQIGYPSQWSNAGYSANVMLARFADGYTLYNYDGEELLDEHFAYIGLVPWAWEDRKDKKLYCANEFLISKRDISGMIKIIAKINGKHFNTYFSDGLIIGTPAGSTAHNVSAGGSIVYPYNKNILLTPICPHSLTQRPLVLSDEFTLDFELQDSKGNIVIDGQEILPFNENDRLRVFVSPYSASLIYDRDRDYFGILREKFNWGV